MKIHQAVEVLAASPFTMSILLLALAVPLWSCAQESKSVVAGNEAILQNEQAKSSYAVGVEMGSKLNGTELALDADAVARGVKDGMTGAETLLSETEMQDLLAALRSNYQKTKQETLRQQRVATGAGVLASIRFAFKPDPRLSNGTYAALPDWVSPQKFFGANGQNTVQVMAGGLDGAGQPIPITPTWTTAAPELIDVAPGEGSVAAITVKGTGEGTVEVSADGVTRLLSVKAEDRAGVITVQMSQAL